MAPSCVDRSFAWTACARSRRWASTGLGCWGVDCCVERLRRGGGQRWLRRWLHRALIGLLRGRLALGPDDGRALGWDAGELIAVSSACVEVVVSDGCVDGSIVR